MNVSNTETPNGPSRLLHTPDNLDAFAAEIERASAGLPQRIAIDPEQVERGLSRLVLALIELLRQLLERQALRRMEGGSLNDEEIERLGQTFMKLATRMDELKQTFGLSDADLNLDLGPLGRLLE
ncbi:MAG: gas vesicle protein K [Roseiflexaceae bacterium]|nr:gas vesicle protein K [Roseiflexaceae bacterium]